MKKYKFFIVGLGSIGQRHIKNLKTLSQDVFAFSYRNKENFLIDGDELKILKSIDEGIKLSDGVFICNTTEKHMEIALRASHLGKHIFVEKPLSNNLLNLKKLRNNLKAKNIIFNSGFMLRHHPNLIFIKSFLNKKKLGNIYYANASVGQDLRQWRQNYNYKEGYAARKETGGGVTLDLIHEIDLINWFFGEAELISSILAFNKELSIETESIANITMKMKSNVVCNIQLDYLSPFLKRNLEIVGELGILNWDYKKGKVYLTNKNEESKIINELDKDFQRNDLYINEIKDFINRIENEKFDLNEYEAASNSLKVAINAINSYESSKTIYNR